MKPRCACAIRSTAAVISSAPCALWKATGSNSTTTAAASRSTSPTSTAHAWCPSRDARRLYEPRAAAAGGRARPGEERPQGRGVRRPGDGDRFRDEEALQRGRRRARRDRPQYRGLRVLSPLAGGGRRSGGESGPADGFFGGAEA